MSISDSERADREFTEHVPCTRVDAIHVALWTGLIAHLIVCAASWILIALVVRGLPGVLWGFAAASVLALLWPVLIIPVALIVGIGFHLLIDSQSPLLANSIRGSMILYELALFGWVIFICLSL